MEIHIHHYFHGEPNRELAHKLDQALNGIAQLLSMQVTIKAKVVEMAGELDALEQEVGSISTVSDSVIALLDGIKAQLDAAGTDPARLSALTAALAAKRQALADAVVRDTPAA